MDDEKCSQNDKPSEMELECAERVQAEAKRICTKLIDNPKFSNCLKVFKKRKLKYISLIRF